MSEPNWEEVPLDDDGGDWEEVPVDDGKKIPGYESLLRGIAQGGTMGYSDEIVGGLEGGLKALTSDQSLADAYKQSRDESRANNLAAQKANPGTYTTGEVGGAIGSAFIPGANIAKGAGLLKTALHAAALGGATGLGYSDADNAKDLAIDTGKSALTGGALGAGAHVVGPMINKGITHFADEAGQTAAWLAGKSLGAERGTRRSIGNKIVNKAGRQALDEGILSPFANTEDMIARNKAVQIKGGDLMNEAYSAVDDAGASTFNPLDAATDVENKLGDFYRSPINRGETNQLENTIESILMRGDGNIPIKEAQALKEELGKVANWKNNLNVSDKEKMAREAYGIVSGHIDDAVKNGAEAIDAAGLNETLNQGKKLYGNSKTAEKLLDIKQAREQGNNLFGLTDAITGAGALGYGGMTDDWKGAGGIMLAKKGLQKYGAQNAALGLNKISKQLLKSPQMVELYQKAPQVFNVLAQKLLHKQEKSDKYAEQPKLPYNQEDVLMRVKGTKYEKSLSEAAGRGHQAFGAAHFILQSKDPDYRKMTMGEEEQKEEH